MGYQKELEVFVFKMILGWIQLAFRTPGPLRESLCLSKSLIIQQGQIATSHPVPPSTNPPDSESSRHLAKVPEFRSFFKASQHVNYKLNIYIYIYIYIYLYKIQTNLYRVFLKLWELIHGQLCMILINSSALIRLHPFTDKKPKGPKTELPSCYKKMCQIHPNSSLIIPLGYQLTGYF